MIPYKCAPRLRPRAAPSTSTQLPRTLWAQIKPGSRTITVAMVREAARLAGLDWTDAECQDLAASLSSLAANVDRIDKPTLSNASPLPFHFNPRPPGVALDLPQSRGRLAASSRVARPTRIEDVAFLPVTQLSELRASRSAGAMPSTGCVGRRR